MSRGWIVARVVLAVLVVGLLVGGGYALYRGAWSHGYAAGQAAETGGEIAAPGWYGYPFPMRPHGFGLGLFFAIGLALLFFAFVGKMMRVAFWSKAMAGGPFPADARWARHWAAHRHWHYPHGPVPPWFWGEPPEDKADKTDKPEAGAEGGEAA